MAQLSRLRRLATVSAAGALLASMLPATIAPASAATPEVRDIESGCPADRVPERNFSDVSPGATHEFTIDCIVWYDFAKGTSSTTYSPGSNTTRAQIAGFLYRYVETAGVPLDDNAPNAFPDDDSSFFHNEINALAALGVVFGDPDTNDHDGDGDTSELIFRPADITTRGYMAAFINRAHEAITGARMTSSDDYFTDDNGTPFEADINALAANGIVTGKTTTTYEPDGAVPRGAMGSFLAREADYLVDLGFLTVPVNGAADIVLDMVDVQQGRSLAGLVYMAEGDSVASLTADGCSVTSEALVVDADNRFSVTIPLSQPATQCQLVFDVTLTDSRMETEAKLITVTETDKFLAGPTLIGTELISSSGDGATIRFEFDEQINSTATRAGSFVLHSFNGSAASAVAGTSASAVSDNVVDVTWTSGFLNATTVSLAKFSVQDLDGNFNVEFAAGVQQLDLTAGETDEPDLVSVSGGGANWIFTFDQPAFNVADDESTPVELGQEDESTKGSQFHLILSDGRDIAGEPGVGGTSGSTSRTLTFVYEGATPVAGYVQAGALSPVDGTTGPGTNPRQSVLTGLASAQRGPYVSGHLIDATSNSVQLTFNEAVDSIVCPGTPLPPCTDADPFVVLFDIFGNSFNATGLSDGPAANQVTATFATSTPWELIAGGTLNAAIVRGAGGSTNTNTVGGFGQANSFAAGETAAPDLVSVTRSSTTNAEGVVTEIRYTMKFDQAFDHVTDGGGTNVFLYDFSQASLNIEAGCAADDQLFELVCTVSGDDLAFAANGAYVSITAGSVDEDGTGTSRTNYHSGFQITT